MDPNATLRQFILSVQTGDYDQLAEFAEAYGQWVGRGGFLATYDGREVHRVDVERERFLVGGACEERWIDADSAEPSFVGAE